MMFAVTLCFAPDSEPFARELADFISKNLNVAVDWSAVISPDAGFLDAAGRALSADAAIFLLSRRAISSPLAREEWEPMFEDGCRAAFVVIEDSRFPKQLLRRNDFDIRRGSLETMRALKRWLIALRPAVHPAWPVPERSSAYDAEALPGLTSTLADRPGIVTNVDRAVACAFTYSARADFEAICWIDCRGRSLAGIVGDLGAQFGLRLPYDLDGNIERIRQLCAERRCLIVLDGATEAIVGQMPLGARASVLATSHTTAPAPDLARVRDGLANWSSNPDSAPTPADVYHAIRQAPPHSWPVATDAARAAIAWFNHHDRIAEAFETAEWLRDESLRRADRKALEAASRELDWILDSWGRSSRPALLASIEQRQLSLSF